MSQNPKKHPGGAPVKLTREVITKLGALLQRGAYIETAVAAVGVVERNTFYAWMRKGAKAKGGLYAELYYTVHKALADAEIRDLMTIETAAAGTKAEFAKDKQGNLVFDGDGKPILVMPHSRPDWKAAAWRLERRHRKRWGPHQTLEHTGPEGGPIQAAEVDPAKLDEELMRLREANELTE